RVEDLSKIIASDLLRRESLCSAGLFLRAIARCTMARSSSFSKSINVRKCRGFMIGFLVLTGFGHASFRHSGQFWPIAERSVRPCPGRRSSVRRERDACTGRDAQGRYLILLCAE